MKHLNSMLTGFVFLIFMGGGGGAEATVFNVTPTTGGTCGVDPNNCTIQEALTVAQANSANDTINLAAGTYDASGGTLAYNGVAGENFSLTIIGTAGAASTIIDAGGSNQVMGILTLTVAAPDDANADLTLRGVTLTRGDNTGFSPGGLDIDTTAADITIEDCVFNNNVADDDGGMNAFTTSGALTLTNNTFFLNIAGDGDQGGADIGTTSGPIVLTGNNFINNLAADDEGGAEISSSSGPITLTNNNFVGNSAVDDRAGARIFNTSGPITLTGNTFTGNNAGSEEGGANISDTTGPITLDSNTFLDNNAGTGSSGGLDVFTNTTPIVLVNNIIANNSAGFDGGGAEVGTNTGTIALTNNTVSGNSAGDQGGGLDIFAADETVVTVQLFNNIIFGNTAVNEGDDIYSYDLGLTSVTGVPTTLSNNDFTDFFSLCANTGGCTPNITQTANLNADPLFVNAAAEDFHLGAASPAVNTGTTSAPNFPATDHDGNPRTIGGEVDMGALEATSSAVSVNPSTNNFGDVTVGNTASADLTITNDGIQDVAFTAMTLSDATNYSLNLSGGASPCGSATVTLSAGDSCTITLVFGPGSQGLKSATLTLASDSADTPSLVVELFGAGVGGGGGCSLSGAALPASGWLLFLATPLGIGLARRFFRKP